MTLVVKHTRLRSEVQRFLATSKRLLINGEWVEARSGRTFATFDPATGEKLTDVAHAEAADVDAAVQAARAAFEGPWSRMKANQRERLIWRIGDLLSERAETFGQLESVDNGKSAAAPGLDETAWS